MQSSKWDDVEYMDLVAQLTQKILIQSQMGHRTQISSENWIKIARFAMMRPAEFERNEMGQQGGQVGKMI